MYLNKILSTSFTPEVRKEQFKMLKENLQSRCHMDYDAFEVIYEGYYFISRPTDQDKEILELLSQYKEYVDRYWDMIEMPVNTNDEEEDEDESFKEHPLYKIADCISNGHPFALLDMEECLEDCESYYKEHEEQFEERGIEKEDCEENPMKVCWIGLVDSLIELDYAIEVEWKDNATILANELAECKAVKRDSSLLNKGWFSPEESIMDGCRTLNKKWRNKGMCLAIMDIGSDSYVMFPCKETVLQDLKKWAKEIDCMITHSGEM